MELLNQEGVPTANPREFNGQFFFTNPDTEDYTAYWNGTPYTFEAKTTSPLFIVDATPLETNGIRKMFAYRLAQRMHGKTPEYRKLEKDSAGKANPQFFDPKVAYEPFIQMCLNPLPVAKTVVGKKVKKEIEQRIDPTTGKPAVRVYGEKDQGSVSLVAEAEQAE